MLSSVLRIWTESFRGLEERQREGFIVSGTVDGERGEERTITKREASRVPVRGACVPWGSRRLPRDDAAAATGCTCVLPRLMTAADAVPDKRVEPDLDELPLDPRAAFACVRSQILARLNWWVPRLGVCYLAPIPGAAFGRRDVSVQVRLVYERVRAGRIGGALDNISKEGLW